MHHPRVRVACARRRERPGPRRSPRRNGSRPDHTQVREGHEFRQRATERYAEACGVLDTESLLTAGADSSIGRSLLSAPTVSDATSFRVRRVHCQCTTRTGVTGTMTDGATGPISLQVPPDDRSATGPHRPTASTFVGRSPGQLAWLRLRRDRTAWASGITLLVLRARRDRGAADRAALRQGPAGPVHRQARPNGNPLGYLGGISADHWFGLEPRSRPRHLHPDRLRPAHVAVHRAGRRAC